MAVPNLLVGATHMLTNTVSTNNTYTCVPSTHSPGDSQRPLEYIHRYKGPSPDTKCHISVQCHQPLRLLTGHLGVGKVLVGQP